MSNAIDRYGVSAWLDNIGLPKLADAVMDEKRFPPVQLEILTCDDCKYADDKPISDGRHLRSRHGSFMYYCSDAERREDG